MPDHTSADAPDSGRGAAAGQPAGSTTARADRTVRPAAERTAPEPGHPVLASYLRRTRRANAVYATVLLVLVLLAFVGVKLAYAHGELNKVSYATAPAPAPVAGTTPGASLSLAWHSDDIAAGGDPYEQGIVVSYNDHTVNGRDALTGQVRWHYTRSDEVLCSVVQQDASTIAIYQRKGNCDEVTGFVTATGEPKWYRTLTDNGHTVATSTSNVVMTVNAHLVHAFDNAGGLDRWNWSAPAGCQVQRALAGALGVLVSLDCNGSHRLMLHDLIADTVRWTVDTQAALVPIAADAFVGALDPATGIVASFAPDGGAAHESASVPGSGLSQLPAADTGVPATDAAGQPVQLVFMPGLSRLVAFSADGSRRWSAPAIGPAWPIAGTVAVAQTAAGTVALRQAENGRAQLSTVLHPSAGRAERVFPVGSDLLLTGVSGSSGAAGIALYR